VLQLAGLIMVNMIGDLCEYLGDEFLRQKITRLPVAPDV